MKKILAALGSLKITVIGLLFLLILTVWGTLYQAENGLYLSQERFYQSWFFLIGGVVPFPGAQSVMAVMFFNLAASMLYLTLNRRMNLGLLATHFGLALMLAAGGVTFYMGSHSNLSLEEGEGSNVSISSGEWEMVLLPTDAGEHRRVSAIDASQLKPGRRIPLPSGGTALRIEEYYRNCSPTREEVKDPPESVAGSTMLNKLPGDKEPSNNFPGLLAAVEKDGKVVGRILLWGGDRGPTTMQIEADRQAFGLRRKRHPLPAVIELVDFRRELHPGSGIAKSYASQVLVRSGEGTDRKVLIAMNKPLRLHSFTFYQSSFASSPGGREISTLEVVQNYGRLMPYIATGITGAGMIIHFAGLLMMRLRRKKTEATP